ncbi:MAG: FAD-dependent oxidoreductase [Bacteroidetes bacterium MedPE-SWsnd-G2]|nr:MAG: FAD-dependent oxidoreductase [Bacteroidetes bacterium MedPE-SWsnd-G2]
MKVDYIIVGCGLAGISICEQLRRNGRSFVVFDNDSQHASTVAAGMYNPVILKRFTEVWDAQLQLDIAMPFYAELEQLLQSTLIYPYPIYRRFSSVKEQNTWFEACDKPALENFLATQLINNSFECIDAPFSFGEVKQAGRVDTNALIEGYKAYLKSNNSLITTGFDFENLQHSKGGVIVNDIQANKIVFAEGYGVKSNPFFGDLPLKEAKGELMLIHAPDLKIDVIVKSSVFIIPEGNDHYSVGATYNWSDKSVQTTDAAKEELQTKLEKFLKCDYTVVEQYAGIRPTVVDRRPLLGRHNSHSNLYVLNGLGTRGVMLGPLMGQHLYNFMEKHIDLPEAINIRRFS